MAHRLDVGEGSGILVLAGDGGVAQAAAIHGLMLRAAAECPRLFVDLRLVERADLTLLQLLASLWRTMDARGRPVALMGDVPEPVRREAARCGLSLEFLNTAR